MARKVISLLTIVGFLIAGCKKGDNVPPVPTPVPHVPGYLISGYKNVYNGQVTDSITYKYDASNRLIEFITASTHVDKKFTYDNNDRIIEMDTYNLTSAPTAKTLLTYNGTSISLQTTDYTPTGAISGTFSSTFTLNASGQMVRNDVGGSTFFYTYSYDGVGNMASLNIYQGVITNPQETHTFTYDNKPGRYSNVKGNYFLFFDRPEFTNNLLAGSDVYFTSVPNNTYSYTYTYNANGYPTSRALSGVPLVQTFSYVYQ